MTMEDGVVILTNSGVARGDTADNLRVEREAVGRWS
jgi:hypothetical protein